MSIWNAARAVLGKKIGIGNEVEQDADLPFGAQIGSLMKINASPFIRANGTLIQAPTESLCQIKAISKMHIGLAGNLYRFYINTGDSATDKETYIQVYVDEQKVVQEINYFDRIVRMFPEDNDTLNAFTGKVEAGLGQLQFSLWRQQLEGIGYQEQVLNSAFGSDNELPYQRMTPSKEEYVQPFEGIEKRIDDRHGNTGLNQKILFMPYARELVHKAKELLFISTEFLNTQNGENKESVHVDFVIGITLSQNDVIFQ